MRGVSGAINGVEIVNSKICEGVSRAINGVGTPSTCLLCLLAF